MNYTNLLTLLLGFTLGVAIAIYRNDSSSDGDALATYTSVEVLYDTIYIRDPAPIGIAPIEILCNVENVEEVANCEAPTEPMQIYTFADTISDLWSAKIVGRDVELRELTLHNRIEYRTQTIYQPPKWEIVAQAYVGNTTSCIGLNAIHNIGRLRISGFVGYNPNGGGDVVVGCSFGVAIWRK